jgi:hypothetical protein
MSSGSSQDAHRDANDDDGWVKSFDGLPYRLSESMRNDLTCALFETIYDQHRFRLKSLEGAFEPLSLFSANRQEADNQADDAYCCDYAPKWRILN